MKKILFINGHLNAGGVERSLMDVLKNFNYEKYQVDLLLLEKMGDYADEIPHEVHTHVYSLDQAFGPLVQTLARCVLRRDWFSFQIRITMLFASKFGSRYLKHAKRLFNTLDPHYDSIVAYRPSICTDFAAYVFEADKKISWWHHGEMFFSGESLKRLGESYSKMDHIVAVSNSSAKLIIDAFPRIAEKVSIISNMIDSVELKKKATEYSTSMDKSVLNIVTVGRMVSEKNLIICPEIAVQLRTRGVAFHWYLIGDGEEYNAIAHAIHVHEMENEFVLTGRLSNPYPYIKDASIMVHPSLVESQGITLLEAMALGTPVIAVSSEGPKEFIRNMENGILVENSVEKIVEAIENALEKKDRLVKNAILTLDDYRPDKIESRIEELLQ